jgi:cytochrome c biogenesis protein CcmG, thiol:disulfide interchange protein DsbE
MTNTIIFWFRIVIILLMAYTVYTYIKASVKRKYWTPRNGKDYKDLFGDALTLAGGLFVLFMLQKNYQEPMDKVMANQQKPFPDLQFMEVKSGTAKKLSDYKGRVVVLNIWATWCPPCRREMPDLDKLEKMYAQSGLSVIALSDEDQSTVKTFIEQHPYQFSAGTFTTMPDVIAGIGTRPVSILIDKKGQVADMVVGARGFNFFEGWVKKYL